MDVDNSASQAVTPAPAVDATSASLPAQATAPIASPVTDTSSVAQPAADSSEAAASFPASEAAPAEAASVVAKVEESSLLGSESNSEAKPDATTSDKSASDKDAADKSEKHGADKPAEKADAEKLPEGESKPVEGAEANLPAFEDFKLPEGFTADEKVMGEFSGLLGQLELAKGDHKSTQEVGQKLVDLFAARMGEATQKMTDYYSTIWNKTKNDRLTELRNDPYFGANGDSSGQMKIQMEMANFLQRNVPKSELNDFRKFVSENGVDNALPLARVLNTLKSKIDKYENEGSRMLPGTKPQPSAPSHPGKGVLQKMYGQK